MTAEAYAACARLARSHYENFPVASVLVPKRMRPHIAAVYAFARTADDFADEGDAAPVDRLARLDAWEARLDAPPGDDPIFVAVHDTIATCRLDRQLFRDLVSAFRQDVTTTRYETWADLIDYCRRSANPVGRLVLGIAGYRDEALARQSDAVCTALQLVNFWQDLERDLAKGRIYVPRESWGGAAEADLLRGAFTPEWRAALEACAARTRALFVEGRPVADGVSGRLRWELRATWLGGMRVLDRLHAQRFDVFGRRPALGFRDVPAILWDMVTWA